MRVLTLRIDEETEERLKFLCEQESAYLLRKVTMSEYIRTLITKESLRFAYRTQQKDR